MELSPLYKVIYVQTCLILNAILFFHSGRTLIKEVMYSSGQSYVRPLGYFAGAPDKGRIGKEPCADVLLLPTLQLTGAPKL